MMRAMHRRDGRVVLALALSGFAFLSLGCGPYCRDIPTTPLAFECDNSTVRFTGEIHLDSEATFRTFLSQQCIADASGAAIDSVVEQVDFSPEAVFVAVGPTRLDEMRCLDSRTLDKAQVCDTGLKVFFLDRFRRAEDCPNLRWTVAFSLLRSDLRAALAAGDNQTP